MNILIIKNPLETYPGGGGEIHTAQLAEALIAKGHKLYYAGSCPYTEKVLQELNVPVLSYGQLGEEATSEWAIIKYYLRERFYRLRLKQLILDCQQKYQIDAVYLISFNEKLLWNDELATLGVKAVGVEHRLMERQFRFNPLKKQYIKNSEFIKLVGVSQAVKDRFVAGGLPAERMQVIHNGIDISQFTPINSYDREPITIGTVSRLFPDKGLERLIQATAYLVPKYHNLRVAIVGDGPEREKLQTLINDLKLNDNVKLLGIMDHAQIPSFLASLDIFTLTPTKGESFGLVLAEAGAMGLPVVANDIGGVKEVVANEKTGFLVSAERADEFNARLETLVNSLELRERLGRAARERVESMFSLSRMCEEYEKLFLQK